MGTSFVADRISRTLESGFKRAYGRFGVNPKRYLRQLRHAHGLPIQSFGDVYALHPASLAEVAERTISGTRRMAVLEGVGFGLGGGITLLPDVSVLGVLTLRLIQKLGLIYGFEYSTDSEKTELWLATASAAGLDVGRDWIRKQVIERLAARIAEKAGSDLAEKLSGAVVPLLGAGIGAVLNAYFIKGWGGRAHRYFREKHFERRAFADPEKAWGTGSGPWPGLGT